MKSSNNFDLNIGNYSKTELEEILELPTDYDENIIQMKETKLRQNIMNNLSIPSHIKTQTMKFISNAKNVLIVNINKIIIARIIEKASNLIFITETRQDC